MAARFFADPDGAGNTREPGPDDRLWLEPGTRIGCGAGHHCYTVTRGLYAYQRIDSEDMDAQPFSPRPLPRLSVGQCMCGRHWVRSRNYLNPLTGLPYRMSVSAMHVIGEGWRTVPDA